MDNLPENQSGRQGMKALMEIARIVQEQLQTDGIPADRAREVGLRSADQVRQHFGGAGLYIAKGVALALSVRDWKIWEKYNGNNHLALAKEYDLTERQIYSIVARCRDEDMLKRQGQLFG